MAKNVAFWQKLNVKLGRYAAVPVVCQMWNKIRPELETVNK